jgi:hypothetical protein
MSGLAVIQDFNDGNAPRLASMDASCGPRKRLIEFTPPAFERGDVIRCMGTGENMLVLDRRPSGALVRRAIGAMRAQPLASSMTLFESEGST